MKCIDDCIGHKVRNGVWGEVQHENWHEVWNESGVKVCVEVGKTKNAINEEVRYEVHK